ncbi:MAG: LamB/YcsF family protein [Rubritalea sp.]|uniref:LamB/YcsF family protein n=1 Tax=Rubritalea sp. TaxID=2109375 RepID=UPI0032423F66
MLEIFLNCDLGEWETREQTAALMTHLDMANIACGGHAGDLQSIKDCAELAEAKKPIAVSTGAHPGIDSDDHGRSLPYDFSTESFRLLLEIQIQRFISAADLNHIKLHGALYHLVEADEDYRKAYLDFVRSHCLISIVCLAGGKVAIEAEKRNLPILPEIFLDRHYASDGSLLPRTHRNAMIHSASEVLERLELLTEKHCIMAYDGTMIELPAHYECLTACVHSDSPSSLEILKAAKVYLDKVEE